MWKNRILHAAILSNVLCFGTGILMGCGGSDHTEGEKTAPPAEPPALVKSDQILAPGTPAPLFSLPDHEGNLVRLADFRGKKNVVLVFYPGDDTPGCTRQLCAIRDDMTAFEDAQTAVFGINQQSAESHAAFVEKYDFPFPLLVDADWKVVEAYGARGAQRAQRTVYGIDRNGMIVFARSGMPSHAEILAAFP